MEKLEPLQPKKATKIWKKMTSYQAIEYLFDKVNETRASVNDAMDVIESDILSNDYAATKALSVIGEAKEVMERLREKERKLDSLIGRLEQLNHDSNG